MEKAQCALQTSVKPCPINLVRDDRSLIAHQTAGAAEKVLLVITYGKTLALGCLGPGVREIAAASASNSSCSISSAWTLWRQANWSLAGRMQNVNATPEDFVVVGQR